MSDIVERLRNVQRDWDPRLTILTEAADEIERLHTDYGILKHDYDTKRAALDDCYREIKRLQDESVWLLNTVERLRAELKEMVLEKKS